MFLSSFDFLMFIYTSVRIIVGEGLMLREFIVQDLDLSPYRQISSLWYAVRSKVPLILLHVSICGNSNKPFVKEQIYRKYPLLTFALDDIEYTVHDLRMGTFTTFFLWFYYIFITYQRFSVKLVIN